MNVSPFRRGVEPSLERIERIESMLHFCLELNQGNQLTVKPNVLISRMRLGMLASMSIMQ